MAQHEQKMNKTAQRVRKIELTQRIHTDAFLRLAKDVREIHRAVHGDRRDVERDSRQPNIVHTMSLLDPVFGGRIPFGSRREILDFFQDKERILRLEAFIMEQVGWDSRSFAKNVLRLLLTKDYRRAVFWPPQRR